jgi:ATP adenylyltransferase
MKHLWSPWRYEYVSSASKQDECIFCSALQQADSDESLILYRAKKNFILLNRYPYNNGHLMIAPYQHIANPVDADAETVAEMMLLSQRALKALQEVYHPDGFNMGMNLGRYAGAGVESHYHMHILPRWDGDTNFMGTIAETRVIPESFSMTLTKLKPHFSSE